MTLNELPLQSLIWPDPALCAEPALYVALEGGAHLSDDTHEIRFVAGGGASFGTAMNLFNVGKWHKYCGMAEFHLELEGRGRFETTIWYKDATAPAHRLICAEVELCPGKAHVLPCTLPDEPGHVGVVFLEVRALGDGALRRADWQTRQKVRRMPTLMLSITTFQREAAVLDTIGRYLAFAERSQISGSIHLTVVDNGCSLTVADTENMTVLQNANYGGSGGFARGLLAAQDGGHTHCLFMDDDATVPFQALERTVMFLAHAKDDRVAVSGALTSAENPCEIWENGARFDVFCRPEFKGTDLRRRDEVVEMELGSTLDKPANYYSGWWYFAFPVSHARYMPFPFFVRGDDIGFCLMNQFRIVPLTGAICFQKEDFSAKESPRTIYLDLRSHVAHHLYAPQLNGTLPRAVKVPWFFFLRLLVSCHYETLSAVNLSLRDVLAGPELFRHNLDMSDKLTEIATYMDREIWRARDDAELGETKRIDPSRFFDRLVMKCTLNGHLLPFFSKFGNHIVLPATARGHRREIWGASRITYVSPDGSQSYTVTHDKRRAIREISRFLWSMCKLLWRYRALREAWKQDYPSLASRAFWRENL